VFEIIDTYRKLRTPARGRNPVASTSRNDAVSKLLATCQSPSELAKVAYRFGIPAPEIYDKAKSASSYGQFRMIIGNRIRGVVRRLKGRVDREAVMSAGGGISW